MVAAWLVVAALAPRAEAQSRVLCKRPNGAVFVRIGLCGKRETPLDVADLGLVGPPGPPGAPAPPEVPAVLVSQALRAPPARLVPRGRRERPVSRDSRANPVVLPDQPVSGDQLVQQVRPGHKACKVCRVCPAFRDPPGPPVPREPAVLREPQVQRVPQARRGHLALLVPLGRRAAEEPPARRARLDSLARRVRRDRRDRRVLPAHLVRPAPRGSRASGGQPAIVESPARSVRLAPKDRLDRPVRRGRWCRWPRSDRSPNR